MNNVNWFAIMILGIWLCATIASGWIKDYSPIAWAAIVTILSGIGYVFLKV